MVSCLMFQAFSRFELILVHGVRVCSCFIDLHAAVQVSQQCLLNRLSFSHLMFLPPLSKINLAHFSNGLFVFAVELYKLFVYFRDEALVVASFETIFSHSVSCLFVFFLVFFAVQKLVSLIRSHWFSFVFISVALGN